MSGLAEPLWLIPFQPEEKRGRAAAGCRREGEQKGAGGSSSVLSIFTICFLGRKGTSQCTLPPPSPPPIAELKVTFC